MHASNIVQSPATHGSVLIVDDEQSLLDVLSRYLGREGFDVTTAANATQALAALDANPVDVMLCDVGLPDMDAVTLVRSARSVAAGLVVVMFSGRHDQRVADAVFEAGAAAYVTKPLPLRDLRDVVEKALRERRSAT